MGSRAWTVPPSTFAKVVKEKLKEKVCTVALAIQNNLIMSTPVDTGRARSNWIPSVGSPASGQMEAGSSARDTALALFTPENLPDFPVVFIANNLPYIKRLNDGWSKQAPRDFVTTAVLDGQNSVL